MKKFYFYLLFLFIPVVHSTKAQHIVNFSEGIDSTFILQDAFANLDTSSHITTGYLWDRTPYNAPLDYFTGDEELDSVVTQNHLIQSFVDVHGSCH